MARSKLDRAVDYLKERGWEFRPAQKIEGVWTYVRFVVEENSNGKK